jgi:hypothetical protein
MIKICFVVLFSISSAFAYVPTVESLLRNGANPDVTMNGVALNLFVRKINPASGESSALLTTGKAEDFYKVYLNKTSSDSVKVLQGRYTTASYTDESITHKAYYPNFTAYTIKPSVEQLERGIFYGLLQSLAYNNGAHLVNYLKSLDVPVRLNQDLINREKIEQLASYKQYLLAAQKNRNKPGLENPMRPDDASARARAEEISNASMYVDTHQVSISRQEGEMSWLINAAPFEAVISYTRREVQKVKFKSAGGEFEIQCKDYWLANGTHSFPKTMIIKTISGDSYQVDIGNLRHYNDKEDDQVKRLQRMDQVLKKTASQDPRPEFLL